MHKNKLLRRNKIEEIIHDKEEVNVLELALYFNVSAETIRTDLNFLEKKGVLLRTRGGAKKREGIISVPYDVRLDEYVDDKRKLARKTLEFIEDDSTIFVDACTSAYFLGTLLKRKKNLTIVTNSIALLYNLEHSGHQIILLGGQVHFPGRRTNPTDVDYIASTMYFDLAILGMDGCLNLDGPANILGDIIGVSKTIIKRSNKKLLICESRKFHTIGYYQYAKFSDFDYVITGKLTQEEKNKCNAKAIIEVDF